MNGKFIISLDFELYWGVRDVRTIENYKANILGVHRVIPKLLNLFETYQIHATFAVVGFLFARNKKELTEYLPLLKPSYSNKNLSPYNGHLKEIGETASTDRFHFGASLIERIKACPNQEIATHTFSHYYCLEQGQNLKEFEQDIVAALEIAKKIWGVDISTIIFPRNQYNNAYINVCKDKGINAFRGNEKAWYYQPASYDKENLLKRGFRLVDAYLNLSGHNCYSLPSQKENYLVNIQSSRFLRPYSQALSWLNSLHLKRIMDSMTYAAKNKLIYHLWWHPHNFGTNQEENFNNLIRVLVHYKLLYERYGFKSQNMKETVQEIKSQKA